MEWRRGKEEREIPKEEEEGLDQWGREIGKGLARELPGFILPGDRGQHDAEILKGSSILKMLPLDLSVGKFV